MPPAKVREDLRTIKERANVFCVQEFTWPWYWNGAIAVLDLGGAWGSYPGKVKGSTNAAIRAQALFWQRKIFTRKKGYVIPAYDFDMNTGKIMRDRYVRAVLLEGKADKFTAWFLSTHFVVGGDRQNDELIRRKLMTQNIAALDKALTHLGNTGYPIMGELDANIHKGTWAYAEFMEMMTKHRAKFHGDLGVEYAFTINGKHGVFTHVDATIIPDVRLNTDHEARVLNWTGAVRKP